jgi:hypothetical protein
MQDASVSVTESAAVVVGLPWQGAVVHCYVEADHLFVEVQDIFI